MAKFPALPLWTDAWVADTHHLSRVARGTYHDLLVVMWRTPGCRVPNDDAWLGARLHMTSIEIAVELRPLIQEFCDTDGNWIVQKRLQKEYSYVRKLSAAQSVRAKSRESKRKNLHPGDATTGDAPTPTPTPTPSSSTKQSLEESVGRVDRLGKALGIDPSTHPYGHKFIEQMIRLEQDGIDFDMDLLPTILVVVSRGGVPTNLKSLNFFRSAALEHKAARELAAAIAVARANEPFEDTDEKGWRRRLESWVEFGGWPPKYGPRPRSGNCKAPAEMLAAALAAWENQGGHPRNAWPKNPNARWEKWEDLRDLRDDPESDYGDGPLPGTNVVALRQKASA